MPVPRVRLTVRRVLILVALVAVCLRGSLRVSDRLPDGWDAREFEAAVREWVAPEVQAELEVELLAWCTREDDRPLRYDSALAWARIEDRKQARWALLELYRHPRKGAQWHLSRTSHSPVPLRHFDRPPTNKDVYDFTDNTHRGDFFGPPLPGFRALNSRVRMGAWYRCVGEMPTRFYSLSSPPDVDRPDHRRCRHRGIAWGRDGDGRSSSSRVGP